MDGYDFHINLPFENEKSQKFFDSILEETKKTNSNLDIVRDKDEGYRCRTHEDVTSFMMLVDYFNKKVNELQENRT